MPWLVTVLPVDVAGRLLLAAILLLDLAAADRLRSGASRTADMVVALSHASRQYVCRLQVGFAKAST